MTNNRRRISRRKPKTRVMSRLLGTTRASNFQTLLPHFSLSAASAGVNNNVFSVNTLMNGDLTSRQVRLMRVTVRFHPYNQSTTSGAHYSAQIQYVNSFAPTSTLVPVTVEKPLSSTNAVTLSGVFPWQEYWQPANSSGNVLNIPIWAQATLVSGIYADITCHWIISQDNLT